MECNCNKDNVCNECKLNNWLIEAKKLKQDLLNGHVQQGNVNAYLSATFTVLELLDNKKKAA